MFVMQNNAKQWVQNDICSSTIAPLSQRPIWFFSLLKSADKSTYLMIQAVQTAMAALCATFTAWLLHLNNMFVHLSISKLLCCACFCSAFIVDERFQFLNFSSHVPVLMKYDLSVLFMWYLLDYLLSVTFLDAVNVCMFSSSISVFRQSPSMGSCRTEQQKFLLWRFHKYIIPPIPIYDQNCPPWKKSVKSCEHLNRPV